MSSMGLSWAMWGNGNQAGVQRGDEMVSAEENVLGCWVLWVKPGEEAAGLSQLSGATTAP